MSSITSSLVTAIESVWADLRTRHPDVPDVVVTMAAGSSGRRGLRLGAFGADRWEHGQQVLPELFIGGEGLAFGARDVLATLLHEAAHGAARTRGITETSRAGAYHNRRFRDIAHEFGLIVERDPRIGWSTTTLPEHTAHQYTAGIATLTTAIVAHRRSEHELAKASGENGEEGQAKASRSGSALVCECSPKRRVRAHKKTIQAGPILCGVCSQPFAVPAEEDTDA